MHDHSHQGHRAGHARTSVMLLRQAAWGKRTPCPHGRDQTRVCPSRPQLDCSNQQQCIMRELKQANEWCSIKTVHHLRLALCGHRVRRTSIAQRAGASALMQLHRRSAFGADTAAPPDRLLLRALRLFCDCCLGPRRCREPRSLRPLLRRLLQEGQPPGVAGLQPVQPAECVMRADPLRDCVSCSIW